MICNSYGKFEFCFNYIRYTRLIRSLPKNPPWISRFKVVNFAHHPVQECSRGFALTRASHAAAWTRTSEAHSCRVPLLAHRTMTNYELAPAILCKCRHRESLFLSTSLRVPTTAFPCVAGPTSTLSPSFTLFLYLSLILPLLRLHA